MRHGFPAFALNDPNGFFGGRLVDVGTEYPRTFACKRNSRCLAVAPARANRPGTDNKCYLAFEPINDVSAPLGRIKSEERYNTTSIGCGLLCTTTKPTACRLTRVK
jgi:hypothetical protein